MENLWRRLKYYGIGFGIGLIFVVVLCRQKGCSWTPGNRVKSALLERIVFVDSADLGFLRSHAIEAKELKRFIESATVSFMDSKRHGNEKIYHFTGDLAYLKAYSCLIAFREKSVVVDFDFEHQNPKKYVRLKGEAKPFLYSKKNWFSGKLKLIPLPGMNLKTAPEKFTQLFLQRGSLDAERSTFETNTPLTYLKYQDITEVDAIHTKAIEIPEKCLIKTKWFQEKIEVMDVEALPK
ncbi:MAG: hypothetical protein ACKO5L_05360 [Bacteroidota bacterium]